jgi:phosphatidylinositol-bisphosphatase
MNLIFWDKTKFEMDLAHFFGKDYVRLHTETLGGIHLIIFIKSIHKNYILNYYKEYIKTGMYGILGNKGGIGIGFKMYNISFMFINCHLSYGFSNVLLRNYDFDYIKKTIHPHLDKFDIIIWMGDFNYRVNKRKEEVENIIKDKKEMDLLQFDQMNSEIKNYNLKSFGYYEGKINFLPTYKYSDDRSNEILCDSNEHIPSWTDRILYKINEDKFKKIENDENKIENEENDICEDIKEENNNESDEYEDAREENFDSYKENRDKIIEAHYNSMQNIVFSDHKPVYAYFNVNIK